MSQTEQLELLRETFLNADESVRTRWLAILASTCLAGVVLWLIRRRALREEFTPLWLAVSAATLMICSWPGLLRELTRWIGAWTPSSTIFFGGQVFLVSLCLHFAVRLSRMTLEIKILGQEIAMLRASRPETRSDLADATAAGARSPSVAGTEAPRDRCDGD